MQKTFLVIFGLLIFSLLVFGAESDIAAAAQALEESDIAGASSSLAGAIDWKMITRIAAVLLGLVVISLIVLRLSQMMSRPRINKEKVKKEKEDKQFKEMFGKKEEILDKLKKQLSEK